MFESAELVNLLKRSEEVSNAPVAHPPSRYADGYDGAMAGEALEGIPPPNTSSKSADRRGSRLSTRIEAAPGPRLEGPVEARYRKQLDSLQASLLSAEEDRESLRREVIKLQAEVDLRAEEQQKPRQLSVLLSAGDGAPSIVKELKLEVRGTRELRDRLFQLQTELEGYKRRLEVDARQEIEKERQTSESLRRQLEEKERTVAELLFDLRRARSAASEGDWAQREEEYMRLNLQNRKLEDELAAHKHSEQELAERLLEQEHLVMELRFDREQVHHRTARLESRILELELLVDGGNATAAKSQSPLGQAAAAALTVASRKERNFESVIEGLERVISQLKTENQRLKVDLDGRKDDRRHRAEVDRLRKRIGELETELMNKDPRRANGRVSQSASLAETAALRATIEEKDRQISDLEARLLEYQASPASVPSASNEELRLVREELRKLQLARSQDAIALDEAQRALEDAERTEHKYLEVARENKRLRTEIAALEDEGFWQVIEQLQERNAQAVTLARESKEALQRYATATPSVEFPIALIARLENFAAAAAA
jgi:chromosome segregation ATPase